MNPQSLGWQLELPLRWNNPLPTVADLLDKNSRFSGLVIQNNEPGMKRIAIPGLRWFYTLFTHCMFRVFFPSPSEYRGAKGQYRHYVALRSRLLVLQNAALTPSF